MIEGAAGQQVAGRREALAAAALVCIAGPDLGKRLDVSPGGGVLGRSSRADLVSEDPRTEPEHVFVRLTADGLFFRCFPDATVRADGNRLREGYLVNGQEVAIGSSTWLVQGRTEGAFFDQFGGHIANLMGLEKVQGFSLREMFSEVSKKRTDEEIEEHFIVGTRATTPALMEIDANWPKPWAFVKIFLLAFLVYVCFLVTFKQFPNEKLLPGLIITGAFAVPLALLIFFFEVNVPRNVSLFQLFKLLCLGGVLSLLFALIGFRLTPGLTGMLDAKSAGIVEEIAKALALVLVVNNLRYRWTLNGLLFGAAVGTGFAAFESAGYAFEVLLGRGLAGMEANLHLRGVLALAGGHIAWTALVGAALWKVKDGRKFEVQMLKDWRFLRVLFLSMALHMFWNAEFQLPMFGKYILIGLVGWIAVLAFVQDGLRQIKREQAGLYTRLSKTPPGGHRAEPEPPRGAKKQVFTIGRQADCDIVLADASVSRRHAQLTVLAQNRFLLADLDSQNGTSVVVAGERRRVREHYLEPDDVVLFGNIRIRGGDLLREVGSPQNGS